MILEIFSKLNHSIIPIRILHSEELNTKMKRAGGGSRGCAPRTLRAPHQPLSHQARRAAAFCQLQLPCRPQEVSTIQVCSCGDRASSSDGRGTCGSHLRRWDWQAFGGVQQQPWPALIFNLISDKKDWFVVIFPFSTCFHFWKEFGEIGF